VTAPWQFPIGIPFSDVHAPWMPPTAPPSPAVGVWTYRSFSNNPDIDRAFNDLEFGRAEMTIEELEQGVFGGRLYFADTHQMRLRGTADLNSFPAIVRFQGVGDTSGTKGWVYDYMGFFVPTWSNGEHQRPAIVGTTVRTVPHDEGKARAGVVGSFIAVKRDDDTT
jgi:hypothetical protein